jgi:plastocyanin
MRRALGVLAGAAALALGISGGAWATSFSAVQATGTEYHISLSRAKIKPGRLRLEFVNYGQDDHDLAIRRVGSSSTHNLGTTHPGDRAVGRFKVRAGTYTLWCTLADHRARGMKATLRVR